MHGSTVYNMFERRLASGGKPYFELCFLPASGGRPVVLVRQGKTIHEIQGPELEKVQPTPFGELNRVGTLAPGQVVLSDILEVTYPVPTEITANRFKSSNVIRFYTSTPGDGTSPPGILFLSDRCHTVSQYPVLVQLQTVASVGLSAK